MGEKKSSEDVKKEIKALLEDAYSFGYFVGYRGHSEWVGWVRERKEELYRKAEKLGVYDLVRSAYRRGREEGAKKREEEINLGLIEKGRIEVEEKLRVETPPQEEGERFEVEFARFLQTTKLLLPPEFLDTLKHLEIPKMLKMGEM
ncbi:hypothetical protein [Thermococcus gorgonarius]|uniref:Uncharacterized protein n=1 Tax=Thermococcus gorgonarius TaxID=71997 RepID=A0A2Z2M512_THEGO|nr:hypothetical protein [Thermococcus gorgonarius]ASJ00987.1 hypothetical protein A3K92_05590 [Thermococcus gorgonarius]